MRRLIGFVLCSLILGLPKWSEDLSAQDVGTPPANLEFFQQLALQHSPSVHAARHRITSAKHLPKRTQ